MSGDARPDDRPPGDDMPNDAMREQLTAYAFGTADAATRSAVERAIASSPELARELDELTEVGALLALTVEPRTPPAGLRDRIMAAATQSRAADRTPSAASATRTSTTLAAAVQLSTARSVPVSSPTLHSAFGSSRPTCWRRHRWWGWW